MKYYLLVLALVAVIAACTSSIRVDDSNGLMINSFTTNPATAEPDDRVSIFLDVENVGGTTARCVVAEIYGVDSWYDDSGARIGGFPVTFGGEGFDFSIYSANGDLQICYRGGLLGDLLGAIFGTTINTQEQVCYTRTRNDNEDWSVYVSGVWNEFSEGLCNAYDQAGQQFSTIRVYPSLEPPLPQRNRPGQFVTTEWILRPPVLPQGLAVDYPVTTRVKYWYSSNANINIKAYNKAEYQRITDLGQPAQSEIDIVNSFGSPIKVTVKRGTSPIVVNQRLDGVELAPYLIELQNVGSGFPLPVTSDRYGETGLIMGTVEVHGPGAYFDDCLGQHGTTGAVMDGLTKMRTDNTAPFGCTIAIDRAQWADRPTDTISLTFNLNYVYYVDAETSVRVYGVESA